MLNPHIAKEFLHHATTLEDVASLRQLSNPDLANGACLNQGQTNGFFAELYRRWIEEKLKNKEMQAEKTNLEQTLLQNTEAKEQLKKECAELQQNLNKVQMAFTEEKQKWQEIEKETANKEKSMEDKLVMLSNEKQQVAEQNSQLTTQVNQANQDIILLKTGEPTIPIIQLRKNLIIT